MYQGKGTVHITNEKSIEDLNEKLPENEKVSHLNFRPNLVISTEAAFEEDHFQYYKINNVNLIYLYPCNRCPRTTVDPNKGRIIRFLNLISRIKFL